MKKKAEKKCKNDAELNCNDNSDLKIALRDEKMLQSSRRDRSCQGDVSQVEVKVMVYGKKIENGENYEMDDMTQT